LSHLTFKVAKFSGATVLLNQCESGSDDSLGKTSMDAGLYVIMVPAALYGTLSGISWNKLSIHDLY
jgi:hypothetical protein